MMSPPHHTSTASGPALSIGAVSKATGIPVETLRTWERRYGFPSPERSDSGHRKYSERVIDHLNLVQAALDRGMRPAHIVGESVETLRALLDLTSSTEATPSQPPPLSSCEASLGALDEVVKHIIERWMLTLLSLDEQAIQHSFEQAWFTRGALSFLNDLVAPFLYEIGQAWYEGRIAVIHEQFASSQLRTFLSVHWRAFSARAQGPHVICATLPGEYHAVGLHMIAVVMSMVGCQILFLGCDTPIQTITQAAAQERVKAALVSVSAAAQPARVLQQLTELRDALPLDVQLVLGGQGAPQHIPHTTRLPDLHALHAWAIKHCPLHQQPPG